jgi:hypothetical protein
MNWERVGCVQPTTARSGCTRQCPVRQTSPRRSRRSREKFNDVRLKFIGLSGEPTAAGATVGRAIRGRRVARANGRLGAPDCPVCIGQCPVRQPARSCNGRLRQIRKEIRTGHATVIVR